MENATTTVITTHKKNCTYFIPYLSVHSSVYKKIQPFSRISTPAYIGRICDWLNFGESALETIWRVVWYALFHKFSTVSFDGKLFNVFHIPVIDEQHL